MTDKRYDVIVVGGGHAGTEAALASSRMGCSTLLLTQNIDTLGQMSCNPAIGGIGKSHLVKEIDALGGVMALAADRAGIHFRTLNARKGPAVRATRAQTDRSLYKAAIKNYLEAQPNLHLFQATVDDLLITDGRIRGISTQIGLTFYAENVVLTVGTFLGGIIHVGMNRREGGRAGDAPSNRLADRLRELPFKVGRLKTGTPPRIDGNTIDYSDLEPQSGEDPCPTMSYLSSGYEKPNQISCYITHTNQNTHDIISEGLDRSPLFTGEIDGVGPRYCPSIEDKVVRFSDRNAHQIFIEPEGLNTFEIYPNGISTSLPYDVQLKFVQSIKGFENAQITRPGYAIEYDFFEPRDLRSSLETRHLEGLYFAGQINGTTGYEEAAAQGLLAGLNAALRAKNQEPWCPDRSEAYIGVLVDDLITLGTKEPYRMFTSRAEYRLILRQDNADRRLTSKGRSIGLVDDKRWSAYEKKEAGIVVLADEMKHQWVKPGDTAVESMLGKPLSREYSLFDLLKRPEVAIEDLSPLGNIAIRSDCVSEQVEIDCKYEGYIARQQREIDRIKLQYNLVIPQDLSFDRVTGLSNEVTQKLQDVKPETIGQAARISGVTPAAVSLLLIYLKKHKALASKKFA